MQNTKTQLENMDVRTLEFTHNKANLAETTLKQLMGVDKKANTAQDELEDEKKRDYKKESVYAKLLYNLCSNDTSNINFNKYGNKGHKLFPISDLYSDNIILGCVIPVQELPTSKKGKEDGNRFIKLYRTIIYNFLQANGIKNVKPKDIKLMGIRSADGGTGHIRRLSSAEVGVF